MSKLTEMAAEYLRKKQIDQPKPYFERLTLKELAAKHEELIKEQEKESKPAVIYQQPVAILTDGEKVGRALGELTNKLFALGRSLGSYAATASASYIQTVRAKHNEPVVNNETQSNVDTTSVAYRILNKESFEDVLPTGEFIKVVNGEITELRKRR
jgi:hypothetical protein